MLQRHLRQASLQYVMAGDMAGATVQQQAILQCRLRQIGNTPCSKKDDRGTGGVHSSQCCEYSSQCCEWCTKGNRSAHSQCYAT